jgi:hypothetical protein
MVGSDRHAMELLQTQEIPSRTELSDSLSRSD